MRKTFDMHPSVVIRCCAALARGTFEKAFGRRWGRQPISSLPEFGLGVRPAVGVAIRQDGQWDLDGRGFAKSTRRKRTEVVHHGRRGAGDVCGLVQQSP